MDEQTDEESTTDPRPELPTPGDRYDLGNKRGKAPSLDINAFTPEQRVSYIMDVRRRVDDDPTKVSDDDIRNAVCCIRLGRADVAKTRRSKKDTPPKVTLADF